MAMGDGGGARTQLGKGNKLFANQPVQGMTSALKNAGFLKKTTTFTLFLIQIFKMISWKRNKRPFFKAPLLNRTVPFPT
jgi:hypothetical protein